ncbi:hypothetical protein [Sinomicrobium oceani]|uniref:hypothetical protein n=1 Tax=Sinomicrobium oceani TaxID=1150368 RepID=UPI00227B79BD|nr:hypothetical protein [Sinomicrobium oceani]
MKILQHIDNTEKACLWQGCFSEELPGILSDILKRARNTCKNIGKTSESRETMAC